jgi:hypothetical protein
MPNPNQTMLNFPLTRKAKAQQRSMSRSTSDDIPLNMPQQFVSSSSLLSNEHSTSTTGNMRFIHNEMVMIQDYSVLTLTCNRYYISTERATETTCLTSISHSLFVFVIEPISK